MDEADKRFTIAQLSDLHCGDLRFDHKLMTNCIEIINAQEPDLVVIAGDLSLDGYREQFEEAKAYIDLFTCPRKIIIAGNHDCRNVGYIHFEELFGPRISTIGFTHSGACGKDLRNGSRWLPWTPISRTSTMARWDGIITGSSKANSPVTPPSRFSSSTTTWCTSRGRDVKGISSGMQAMCCKCYGICAWISY